MKKNNALSVLLLLVALIFSCKKDGLLSINPSENLDLQLNKQNLDYTGSSDCYTTYFNTLDQYNADYGVSGPKYNPTDGYSRDSAFYELGVQYLRCTFASSTPVLPAVILPKATRSPFKYYDFLSTLGLANGSRSLCNQSDFDEYILDIGRLNAIIKRTVDDVGSIYYYSASQSQRLAMLYHHVNSDEAPMFLNYIHADVSFAFNYFLSASSLSVVPRVVAVALFGKSSALPPVVTDENGNSAPPVILENWEGFVISHDPAVNVLSDYCNSGPTFPSALNLPSPLPSDISYFIGFPSSVYPVISTTTPIFFSLADNKYYTDQNFTTLVPNGYYKHPINNGDNLFYHIVNGIVTETVQKHTNPNTPYPG